MRRVNAVFVAVVVGAVLTGAVTATGFGTELSTVNTISIIENQLRSDVTELRVVDQELQLTVRITNPTGYQLGLDGTFVRVFQGGPDQLAYGAGQRTDDGSDRIPARGSLTVRYVVGLSPSQAEDVRSAIESGPVQLTVFHSLTLKDESFNIGRGNITVTGEVGE